MGKNLSQNTRPTDCSPLTNWSKAAFARYMTIDLRFSFSLNNHVNLLIPHLIRKLDSSFTNNFIDSCTYMYK